MAKAACERTTDGVLEATAATNGSTGRGRRLARAALIGGVGTALTVVPALTVRRVRHMREEARSIAPLTLDLDIEGTAPALKIVVVGDSSSAGFRLDHAERRSLLGSGLHAPAAAELLDAQPTAGRTLRRCTPATSVRRPRLRRRTILRRGDAIPVLAQRLGHLMVRRRGVPVVEQREDARRRTERDRDQRACNHGRPERPASRGVRPVVRHRLLRAGLGPAPQGRCGTGPVRTRVRPDRQGR